MKKLICVLAIAATAITASASSVSWGLSAGQSLDSTKVDAGTAYLVYTTGTLNWGALETMTSFDASSLAAVGFTATVDTFSYSNSKLSNTISITPTTQVGGSAIGGGQKQMYIVVIDNGGKDIAYTAAPTVVNVQNSTFPVGATKIATAFTYAEAVPEPTSGLLLLLGVAGLALKRKRA